jgi:hypothetical protein
VQRSRAIDLDVLGDELTQGLEVVRVAPGVAAPVEGRKIVISR